MSADVEALARFVDRVTMVYDREYTHPIDRVWEAVTTAEHFAVWMLPECRIERRLGGICAFGWGGEIDETKLDTITAWEPPSTVQYTSADGSFMRFDLETLGAARTLLHFTLHFLPDPNAAEEEPWTGGDLPAGRDTPWRPGFVAGFHEFLDDLRVYLEGGWTADDRAAHLAGEEAHQERHARWVDVYRSHIRDHCPKDAG